MLKYRWRRKCPLFLYWGCGRTNASWCVQFAVKPEWLNNIWADFSIWEGAMGASTFLPLVLFCLLAMWGWNLLSSLFLGQFELHSHASTLSPKKRMLLLSVFGWSRSWHWLFLKEILLFWMGFEFPGSKEGWESFMELQYMVCILCILFYLV